MEQKFVITGPPESRKKQRKLGILNYIPPPGAIKLICHRCGIKVWIGPKQQEAIKRSKHEVVCTGCMIEMVKENGGGMPDIQNLGGIGGSYLLDGDV